MSSLPGDSRVPMASLHHHTTFTNRKHGWFQDFKCLLKSSKSDSNFLNCSKSVDHRDLYGPNLDLCKCICALIAKMCGIENLGPTWEISY